MGLYLRLTISFILCIFEYASLGFLSLEPGRRIMNNYFPRGNSTQPSGSFFENAADGGFDFNRTGWIIAASYCSLMLAVVLCYFVVFLKELGYGCFFDAERYERSNKHCCTVLFGKSFLLMWILFPAHVLCLFFIIYWDIRELREESADDAVDEVTFQHHELLTNIVFFLGDILLLKHVLVRWKALRIRDLRVSLFLETHVHLDDPDGGHGFRRRHALEEALEEEREHDNNGRRVHGAFGRRGHGRGREDFGEHSPLLPVNSHEASHLSSS